MNNNVGTFDIRVFVYWNLHRKCWSVRALNGTQRGRVVLHANVVTLRDATARVSQSGRARVLREGRKNVHAGIVGTLESFSDVSYSHDIAMPRTITYSPYRYTSFVFTDERDTSFVGSSRVHMNGAGFGSPVVTVES